MRKTPSPRTGTLTTQAQRMYGMYGMLLNSRVSTWDISCSCRAWCNFRASLRLKRLKRVAICSSLISSAEREVFFVLHLKSVKFEIVVRPIWSSLISLKRIEREHCSCLEWVFTLKILFCRIIIVIWWGFYRCFYVRKEKFLIFRRACEKFHTSCQIVSRFILLMTYRHVLATVIALNHSLKAQKSRQIASIVN